MQSIWLIVTTHHLTFLCKKKLKKINKEEVPDIEYNSLRISNSEDTFILDLNDPNQGLSELSGTTPNVDTLAVSNIISDYYINNKIEENSSLCCPEVDPNPINLVTSNSIDASLEFYITHDIPSTGTTVNITVTKNSDSSVIFSGNSNSGVIVIDENFGLEPANTYTITATATNCHSSITETETVILPSVLEVIHNGEEGDIVQVSFNSNNYIVDSGTSRSFLLPSGTNVEIINSIVDLNTQQSTKSINIDYNAGPYKFFSRLLPISLNGTPSSGQIISTIPDSNNVANARQHNITMSANNYVVEINFKEIDVVDFDFENPICTDNTQNGQTVATVKDTKEVYQGTQTTPAGRSLLQNNSLISPNVTSYGSLDHGYITNPSKPQILQNVFTVGKMNTLPNVFTTAPSRVSKLDHSSSNYHYTSIWAFGGGRYNGVGAHPTSFENTFGYHTQFNIAPVFKIGYPTPAFDMAANTGQQLVYSFGFRNGSFLKCNGIDYVWNTVNFGVVSSNPNTSISNTFSFANSLLEIGTQQGVGRTEVSRILFTGELTQNEFAIIRNKIETKY